MDSLVSVAEAAMARSRLQDSDDKESGLHGTPPQFRRRLGRNIASNLEDEVLQQESMMLAPQKRVNFAATSSYQQSIAGVVSYAMSPIVNAINLSLPTTSATPISTSGGNRSAKVKYNRNVSYPTHGADENLGGESGNESDLDQEDEEFLTRVKAKSKNMIMLKAAKQSVRLEQEYEKLDESWDSVLLNLVKHERNVRDERDMKFSLGLLLTHHGADPNTMDELSRDRPLHYTARRGQLEATDMLLQHGAKTYFKNDDDDTPLLVALKAGHDEVAARIMQSMKPAEVRDVFIAHDELNCKFSFHELVENKEMKLSLTTALDNMVRKVHNQADNSYEFFMQILDGDRNGRNPKDPLFDKKRTALQLIAKTCNKTAVYHNIVRILLWHKWKQFVSKKFWIQTGVFCIYVVIMTFALIAGGEAEDPTKYNHGIDVFRGICEILSLLFCTYGLAAEVNQLRKHGPKDYFEDLYNYADIASFGLFVFVVLPLRFAESPAQWTVASFGYVATGMRFFKYTCAFRNIGAYTQILGRIVRQDIVRFMIIFFLFLVTFSGSFFLALRGQETSVSRVNATNIAGSDLDKSYHIRSYPEILLTGLRIMIESGPIIMYYEEDMKLGWLGIVVILGFMFVVIVVLLNILIAQLSDTYQNVQSDAQREVELNRAYIVGHVEKNSLLYKDLLRDHYFPSIIVSDPVNILERWESPPLNDLHKSLHRINGRLAHYDSSFVNIEHSQGHQTALLNSLQQLAETQGLMIEKLLRKVKRMEKRKKKRRMSKASQEGGEEQSSTDEGSTSDSSDVVQRPYLHVTHSQCSDGVEDDELGGIRHTPSPAPKRISGAVLQPGLLATAAVLPHSEIPFEAVKPRKSVQRQRLMPTIQASAHDEKQSPQDLPSRQGLRGAGLLPHPRYTTPQSHGLMHGHNRSVGSPGFRRRHQSLPQDAVLVRVSRGNATARAKDSKKHFLASGAPQPVEIGIPPNLHDESTV